MRVSDLPLTYNAVSILEHNLPGRAGKTALFSLERNLTFQQAHDEVNQVGNALKKLGVRMGEYVGLLALDGPEWVTTFFGTLKIGAIHAGLNTLLTPAEYDYMIRDCRMRVLVVHEKILPAVQGILPEQPFLEHVVVIGRAPEGMIAYKDWIEGESTNLETTPTHREDIATLNYSSGTTGQPKGIPHAHKDLVLTAENSGKNTLGFAENDRTFAGAKLFFTFGTGGNLLFPWHVGASCVLFSGSPRVATNLLEMVDRFKPTILFNSPTGYAMALAVENFQEKYDLSTLRICVSAGEALPAPIWHQWKERTGLDIIDGIGATEAYNTFISNRPGDIRPGSSGKPVEGYEVRIVDYDLKATPQGETGNLLVKGDTVALSYLHQYEKSRKTFLGEWFFTGDQYYADKDGYYHHAGRADDMLKVGGIWVSPVEVEATLTRHPAVLQCAVVGKADESDLIKPKAFVILNEGYSGLPELETELIEFCREHMAGYKRPRWVEFVSELPRTATGKIQRFKLRG
ncbi:MAG TPA: benzoate-CoA ligase family protein [Anaerolineales bacterium]|nr:benzoate-CoA ligase family protein [Anaerolineales bacterium]